MTNKIKILGLIMLFVFTATFSYSQKCKYEYEKKDELTGLVSKAILQEFSTVLNFRIKALGDSYSMDVLIYFPAMTNQLSAITLVYLEEGDAISFKLSTGEIVSIPVPKRIKPELRQDKWAFFHLYDNIPIDKELLEKLSSTTVSYACLCNEKKIAESTLKEKEAKAFQEKLKCILQ